MYHGDIWLGDTIDIKFTTVDTSGVPTTLAGTPVVSAYPGNSTTELTAGITLTVDFDSRTGLHNVRVVATGANGYATATNYVLVITTGTVGGSSVVGYVVGSFSIERNVGLSAQAKLDVNAEVDTAFTTQMADSVPTDGTIPTREQAIYEIIQMLTEHILSGTTLTVRKVDGSTTLMTLTTDSATNPTSITRAT